MDDFLWTVGYYSEGQLHGASFAFRDGHRKEFVADWVRGELRDQTHWNAAGLVTANVRFIDADLSEAKHWYDSGAPKFQMEMSAGEPSGGLESWYESGTLRARGRYYSGKRVGSWQCWDEKGDKNFSVTYDEVGTMIDWSTSASTIEEWMRHCVQGCPGERLEDLDSAEQGRRCGSDIVTANSRLQ
jgi:antitoxin component YwqK of YwqJK toxin-antitoxin module